MSKYENVEPQYFWFKEPHVYWKQIKNVLLKKQNEVTDKVCGEFVKIVEAIEENEILKTANKTFTMIGVVPQFSIQVQTKEFYEVVLIRYSYHNYMVEFCGPDGVYMDFEDVDFDFVINTLKTYQIFEKVKAVHQIKRILESLYFQVDINEEVRDEATVIRGYRYLNKPETPQQPGAETVEPIWIRCINDNEFHLLFDDVNGPLEVNYLSWVEINQYLSRIKKDKVKHKKRPITALRKGVADAYLENNIDIQEYFSIGSIVEVIENNSSFNSNKAYFLYKKEGLSIPTLKVPVQITDLYYEKTIQLENNIICIRYNSNKPEDKRFTVEYGSETKTDITLYFEEEDIKSYLRNFSPQISTLLNDKQGQKFRKERQEEMEATNNLINQEIDNGILEPETDAEISHQTLTDVQMMHGLIPEDEIRKNTIDGILQYMNLTSFELERYNNGYNNSVIKGTRRVDEKDETIYITHVKPKTNGKSKGASYDIIYGRAGAEIYNETKMSWTSLEIYLKQILEDEGPVKRAEEIKNLLEKEGFNVRTFIDKKTEEKPIVDIKNVKTVKAERYGNSHDDKKHQILYVQCMDIDTFHIRHTKHRQDEYHQKGLTWKQLEKYLFTEVLERESTNLLDDVNFDDLLISMDKTTLDILKDMFTIVKEMTYFQYDDTNINISYENNQNLKGIKKRTDWMATKNSYVMIRLKISRGIVSVYVSHTADRKDQKYTIYAFDYSVSSQPKELLIIACPDRVSMIRALEGLDNLLMKEYSRKVPCENIVDLNDQPEMKDIKLVDIVQKQGERLEQLEKKINEVRKLSV